MARNKSKKKYLIIGAVLLLVIFVVPSALQGNILSGYGGMTAEIMSVNDASNFYLGDGYDFQGSTRVGGTYAQVDPKHPGIGWPDPTGIKMELTSRLRPVYEASKVLGNIEKPILDPSGVQIGEERVVAKIVPMIMGVSVRTFGVGNDPIYDIVFTIRIQENQFSYFGDADEAMAYIVAVYLINPPQTTHDQNIQVQPSSGGAEPQSYTRGTNPVPEWINEAAGEISYNIPSEASIVDSQFVVTKAKPNTPLFQPREENEASWEVGIDVLIFGKWSVEGELPIFEPKDAPTFFDDFFIDLSNLIGAGFMSLAILGIIGIVIFIIFFFIMRGWRGGSGGSGGGSGKNTRGNNSGRGNTKSGLGKPSRK